MDNLQSINTCFTFFNFRSRVGFDARHYEKHLDEAEDGQVQLDRADGVRCATVTVTHNVCRLIGKIGKWEVFCCFL